VKIDLPRETTKQWHCLKVEHQQATDESVG